MGNRTLGNMRFGPPKNFLVKACYYIMNYGGVTVLVNTDIWNLPVPKNVKKFAWLVFHNKINTKKIVSITTPINPSPNKTSPSPHAAYTSHLATTSHRHLTTTSHRHRPLAASGPTGTPGIARSQPARPGGELSICKRMLSR
jgi:hypothetical protein